MKKMSIKSHQERNEVPLGPKAALVISFVFQERLDLGKGEVLDNFVCFHVLPLQNSEPNQLST